MPSIFMSMPTQRITILCQNGKVYTRVKAIINTKTDDHMILFEGQKDMVSAGDRIEYKTPEGLTITYVITDPGFHQKKLGVTPYYSAKVKEEAQYYRTASDEVIPVPFTDGTEGANVEGGKVSQPSQNRDVTSRVEYAGPIVSEPKNGDKDSQISILFATLRTIANGQRDREALLFLLDQLEQSVGTSDYPAMYNAFMQAVADRMSEFARFVPDLSRLLVSNDDNEAKS